MVQPTCIHRQSILSVVEPATFHQSGECSELMRGPSESQIPEACHLAWAFSVLVAARCFSFVCWQLSQTFLKSASSITFRDILSLFSASGSGGFDIQDKQGSATVAARGSLWFAKNSPAGHNAMASRARFHLNWMFPRVCDLGSAVGRVWPCPLTDCIVSVYTCTGQVTSVQLNHSVAFWHTGGKHVSSGALSESVSCVTPVKYLFLVSVWDFFLQWNKITFIPNTTIHHPCF